MTSTCLGCGAPLDADRRSDAQTCDAVCRNRVFRAKRDRLAAIVRDQAAAIAASDFAKLEELVLLAAKDARR